MTALALATRSLAMFLPEWRSRGRSARAAGGSPPAASALAPRSPAMFLSEWRRKGYVSENLSAITGTGDDPLLSSDPFHSWGALFGVMAFTEAGVLAPPEDPLSP